MPNCSRSFWITLTGKLKAEQGIRICVDSPLHIWTRPHTALNVENMAMCPWPVPANEWPRADTGNPTNCQDNRTLDKQTTNWNVRSLVERFELRNLNILKTLLRCKITILPRILKMVFFGGHVLWSVKNGNHEAPGTVHAQARETYEHTWLNCGIKSCKHDFEKHPRRCVSNGYPETICPRENQNGQSFPEIQAENR